MTVTEYDPDVVAVIVCVVCKFDQPLPVAEDEVKSTEPPAQNVVGPLAVIVGVAGAEFTVTAVVADIAEHPFPSVY